MRNLIALVTLAMLGACGGDSSTKPLTPTGSLTFRLDAQSCTGSGTLNFFVDGATLGSATLAAGQSQTYANIPAGKHLLGASEVRTGGYVWTSAYATIPEDGSYTHLLICG